MISFLLKKIVGSQNEREIKKFIDIAETINSFEPEMNKLPSTDLRNKTEQFKEIIEKDVGLDGDFRDEKYFNALEDSVATILPEAFAVVREVGRRTLGMRLFDVQLVGGMVLHTGRIAEMKTGEGKTLVAALPLYLKGITGFGSHLITVNDYLAARDATWMGSIYNLLGLKVGVINHDVSYTVEWENPERAKEAMEKNYSVWPNEYIDEELPPEKNFDVLSSFKTTLVPCSRQDAYRANISYGTNNEFGFDYLRDNMKFSLDDYVQRDHFFAIVDEVDSILIDEARTPLIISGPSENSTELYYDVDKVVKGLKIEEDFTIDEKSKQVNLSESGTSKIEKLLNVTNLYDPVSLEMLHHVNQALRAHHLFKIDVDYMIKDGMVVIVDEFTGRLMPGRRWSDGLHQAVEAKENVDIESENQTLATITIQNYFRMYKKLAGMTGTADTEAAEFKNIYKLDVNVIPTHKPLIRLDNNDAIYKTEEEKYEAVCDGIRELNEKGVPVLVGTASIEQSELISKYLDKQKLSHNVLNAKQHSREAEVIAQAGRVGAITIATNMAGRGTDILLGGNPDFLAKDVLKKEYNVDEENASSEQFEEAMAQARLTCDSEKARVIEEGGLHIVGTCRHESRRIDNQLRGRSGRQGDPGSSRFYISLQDDLMRIFASDRISGIMDKLGWEKGEPIEHKMITKSIENAQKKVEGRNFDTRKHLLEYDDVLNTQRDAVYSLRKEILLGGESLKEHFYGIADVLIDELITDYLPEKIDTDTDFTELHEAIKRIFNIDFEINDELLENIDLNQLSEFLKSKTKEYYEHKETEIGSDILRHVERYIMLQTLDYIWKDHLLNMDHLREGIGDMFSSIVMRFNEEVCEKLFKVQPVSDVDMQRMEEKRKKEEGKMVLGRGEDQDDEVKQPVRRGKKIGRNEPCPCGSGKKYKKCHGK
jgi:preprotein translocase subunit SecA